MNFYWIFCAFLCYGQSENVIDPSDWVDSLTRYIIDDSEIRQLVVITNFAKNETITGPRMEQIFTKLIQNLPTVTINIGDFEKSKIFIPDNEIDDLIPIETSTTLFIIVHESRDKLPILPSKKFINLAAMMPASLNRPKYLLLFFPRVLSDSLEEFFQYAWAMDMLDFTIVESTKLEEINKLIRVNDELDRPIVHQFNPFKKTYTKIKWTPAIVWFPNKTDNMWNYPLKLKVFDYPPFLFSRVNEYGKPVDVHGANIRLTESIARKLNLTLEYFPEIAQNYELTKTNMNVIASYKPWKTDMTPVLCPYNMRSSVNDKPHTRPILIDEYCPVVPILPRLMMPLSINFFKSCVLFFGIVMIIWIVGQVLRFQGHLWQPFFIFCALYGFSVTRQPTVNSERILFACLFVVSTIYSSTIYSTITDISLQMDAEMEFNSLEDLDNSGLTPIISPLIFDEIFTDVEGTMMNLKNKSVKGHFSTYDCALLAAKHKNITCIVARRRAEVAVASTRYNGRASIKIAKPCFGSRSFTFRMSFRSPYRSSLDSVIERMQSGGLVDKFYQDEIISMSKSQDDKENSGPWDNQSMIALRQQLIAVLVIGYTLSLLIFIGEIIVHRTSKYKE